MYLLPGQLLIKHVWIPKQTDFLDVYHALQKDSHSGIITYLQGVISLISDTGLRWHLTVLCTKIQSGITQQYKISWLFRVCFCNHPLGTIQFQAS